MADRVGPRVTDHHAVAEVAAAGADVVLDGHVFDDVAATTGDDDPGAEALDRAVLHRTATHAAQQDAGRVVGRLRIAGYGAATEIEGHIVRRDDQRRTACTGEVLVEREVLK
ncbi:MAG: hypothetical protein M3356_07230 [Actinomycetota bacterium]|nr:hypothetical protein [Actinomycetota bacterium]